MKGRTQVQQEAIDRTWEGLPVLDAPVEMVLLIVVKSGDYEGATRGDPHNCALARACKRLFDSKAAVFFKSVAYIDLPDDEGRRAVYRFRVDKKTKRLIIRFDQTGEFPPGGFRVVGMEPSNRFDARREYQRDYRRGDRRRARTAVIQGATVAGRREKPSLVLEGVRSGQGMVQFQAGGIKK